MQMPAASDRDLFASYPASLTKYYVHLFILSAPVSRPQTDATPKRQTRILMREPARTLTSTHSWYSTKAKESFEYILFTESVNRICAYLGRYLQVTRVY